MALAPCYYDGVLVLAHLLQYSALVDRATIREEPSGAAAGPVCGLFY